MEPSLSWQAPEYYHEPKSSDWFWAVGIIAASIALLCFIYSNFILGILTIIAAFSIMVHANRPGPMRSFTLTVKGIKVDKKFYPYNTLDTFWIDTHEIEHEEHGSLLFGKLLIKSKKRLMPLIVIPIEELHPDEIQEFLSIFLEEEELIEPLGQKLIEYLGF